MASSIWEIKHLGDIVLAGLSDLHEVNRDDSGNFSR
jgi:hypothetical protein